MSSTVTSAGTTAAGPRARGHRGPSPSWDPLMVYAPWGCRWCSPVHRRVGDDVRRRQTEAGLFVDGGYAERMWVKDRPVSGPALGDLDPIAVRTPRLRWSHCISARRSAVCRRLSDRFERWPRYSLIGAGGLGQYFDPLPPVSSPDRARHRARHFGRQASEWRWRSAPTRRSHRPTRSNPC